MPWTSLADVQFIAGEEPYYDIARWGIGRNVFVFLKMHDR